MNFFLKNFIKWIPVDCDPTTAIIGRLTYKLTSDFRIISLNIKCMNYLDLWYNWDKFLHGYGFSG